MRFFFISPCIQLRRALVARLLGFVAGAGALVLVLVLGTVEEKMKI